LHGAAYQAFVKRAPLGKAYEFSFDGTISGRWLARQIFRPTAGSTTRPAASQAVDVHLLSTLLVQIGLILMLSRVVGLIFTRIGQPQVMGEMVAGIMLGPSLFGLLMPATAAWVFPANSITYLSILSQLGVIFFLFLIGLELDPKLLRSRGHAAIVISHASIIAPFLLGAAMMLFLYTRLLNDAPHMQFRPVALFIGAAMSITAFPVLARILTERNLHKTDIGAVTITCAAVDDVSAWCLLAFVVAIARAEKLNFALITAGFSVMYVLAMFFLVRPFLHRLQLIFERQGRLTQNVTAVVFLLVLTSAYTTEKIGIHALFGAFLMGAIMPKGTQFVRHLSEKLEDYTVVFLLPLFFAFTGLKTQIGLLNSGELWLYAALIILVACAGKFGGSVVAARLCGIHFRESAAIGILMNTRGLMELVILNIGRELDVISEAVFAMMVLMALVTTAMTTPLLHLFYPRHLMDRERTPIPAGRFSVLIPVSLPASARALVQIADMISGIASAQRRIHALFLRRPIEQEAYRAAADQSQPDASYEPLAAAIAEANARGIPIEPVSFVTRDVPGDIVTAAESHHDNLILMGFHKPVFGTTILGGTVHRVLSVAPVDVGILVDRGLPNEKKSDRPLRLLVPYLGGRHDRFALELANRMSKNTGAAVTVLHVVAPNRHQDQPALNAKAAVERVFAEPGSSTPMTFRVMQHEDPIRAVLDECAGHDLLVLGVAEEWGLTSHLFGFRPERIARDCTRSLLMVRKAQSTTPAATLPPAV
jgi:Kef-type K+ transport system membrane component KefB/nucleotide-binding universal stress UspA family protein